MNTQAIVKKWKIRLLQADSDIKALCSIAKVAPSVFSVWGQGAGDVSDDDIAVVCGLILRDKSLEEAMTFARKERWSRSRAMIYTYIRVEWALIEIEDNYVAELIRLQA